MDEPLSNLDAKLRVSMRAQIAKLHQELGTTKIYVTHDQTEAMTMADRIVIMKDGKIQQVGSPQEVYDDAKNFEIEVPVGRLKLLKDKGFDNKKVIMGIRPEDIHTENAFLGTFPNAKLVLLYLTYAIPQTLFLYVGYIKMSIPEGLDEAAQIDGANKFTTYFKIIFPKTYK